MRKVQNNIKIKENYLNKNTKLSLNHEKFTIKISEFEKTHKKDKLVSSSQERFTIKQRKLLIVAFMINCGKGHIIVRTHEAIFQLI